MEKNHEQLENLKSILEHLKTLREGRCKQGTCKFQDTICPLERFAGKSQTRGSTGPWAPKLTWGSTGLTENVNMIDCTYQSSYHTEQKILNLNMVIEEFEKTIILQMI